MRSCLATTRKLALILAEEMRDGFNKVILANEVNGGLAEKVDHLTIATSHRVMVLEEKLK